MGKYEVRRIIECRWADVEAETPEEALAATKKLDTTSIVVKKERARNMETRTAKASITDRELRSGRRFFARYHGKEYTATVTADGQVEVVQAPHTKVGKFKSLNLAGQAIVQHAINAWAFWHDEAKAAPAPKAEKKAAPAKAKGKAPAKGLRAVKTEPAPEPPAEPKEPEAEALAS